MADSYRTFVQITVPPGSLTPMVASLEVGHFLDGPADGMARLEVVLSDATADTIVLAL